MLSGKQSGPSIAGKNPEKASGSTGEFSDNDDAEFGGSIGGYKMV